MVWGCVCRCCQGLGVQSGLIWALVSSLGGKGMWRGVGDLGLWGWGCGEGVVGMGLWGWVFVAHGVTIVTQGLRPPRRVPQGVWVGGTWLKTEKAR